MKKAIDEYKGYIPGIIKTIKSKTEYLPDMVDVDDGFTRFIVGTKESKVFDNVEYKVSITGYDHKKRVCHII